MFIQTILNLIRRYPNLKWPLILLLIRHGESAYNVLKKQKAADPDYRVFKLLYDAREQGQSVDEQKLVELAQLLVNRYKLTKSDADTELTELGIQQAIQTGIALRQEVKAKRLWLPDVIYVSPYLRTQQTLECIIKGFEELGRVPVEVDARIREREHGLADLYNDHRCFYVLHPEQWELRKLQGEYHYRFPQGESSEDVNMRMRSMLGTIIREYSGKRVFIIGHHLGILSYLTLMHHLTPEQYHDKDTNEKPVNCGVTLYRGIPGAGRAGKGKLVQVYYNKNFHNLS